MTPNAPGSTQYSQWATAQKQFIQQAEKFNLVGPTYPGIAKVFNSERTVNLYPEVIEGGHGKARVGLIGTPGYVPLITLPDSPLRGLYTGDGINVYAVAGGTLFHIYGRQVPLAPMGQTALMLGIIALAGGGNPSLTAATWAGYYTTFTGFAAPIPSTYGFGGPGSSPPYTGAATVTYAVWSQLFFAPVVYNICGNKGDIGAGFDTFPVYMMGNGGQLFVVSGNQGYCFTGTAVLKVVAAVTGSYIDGYFVALNPDEQNIYLSAPFDGTTWPPLLYQAPINEPSSVVQLLLDHDELWIFKERSITVWDDTGQNFYPLQPNPAAYIEQGCAAAFSPAKLDNTVFWLGSDDRGYGICWRAQGYTPERISTHAVEYQWSTYPQIWDAEAFAYQQDGHSFYLIHFPSANPTEAGPLGATWVYDCAASQQLGSPQWHERAYWNTQPGNYSMWRGRCHCAVSILVAPPNTAPPGTIAGAGPIKGHLIGDWYSGTIYLMDPQYRQDAGNPLRWLRQSPHLGPGNQKNFFSNLFYDMQVGVGLPAPINVVGGTGGTNPQVYLRRSNDGGQTWSASLARTIGAEGKYKTRVRSNREGSARDRVFEISGSDPVFTAIIDGSVDVHPGME